VTYAAQLALSGSMQALTALTDVDAMNATDAPTEAPAPAPAPGEDPCAPPLAWATRLNGEVAYQFVAATLLVAFLVAWVRRSTNQRAIMLGFGVESALSLVHFIAIVYFIRAWITCLNPDYETPTSQLVNNVFLILARLAQTGTAIAAGCGNNKKMGLAFAASCAFYFVIWLGFEVFSNEKSIGDLIENNFKDIVNALGRSVPGALAGVILAIQRAPAGEEEGVEMP